MNYCPGVGVGSSNDPPGGGVPVTQAGRSTQDTFFVLSVVFRSGFGVTVQKGTRVRARSKFGN